MSVEFYARINGEVVESNDFRMKFPAGEQHIVERADGDEIPLFAYIRGCNTDDYVAAAMWIDLQHDRGHHVAAIIPYLPGARQDRGRPNGAFVYAQLINAMNADQVICFDPHSSIMPGMIKRLTVVESTEVIANVAKGYTGVIAPDLGAESRARAAAAALGVPLYHARKDRDFITGKLTGFSCQPLMPGIPGDPKGARYLVVDDICDGGGTFIGLAGVTGLPREQLGLFVSHGVFSGKAPAERALTSAFGEVITTDSHPGWPNYTATVHEVLPYLTKELAL